MGDSGSQVLGFGLASLALASSWTVAGTTFATVLLPLLILAVPILDTTLVTTMRLAQRRPVTRGGRDHSSHRLVYYGLSEAKAVLLLALVAAAVGATALAYNVLDNARLTAVGVLLTFVLLVQFGSFLSDLEERSRSGREGPPPSLWRAVVFEPRRLVEVVADSVLICGSFRTSARSSFRCSRFCWAPATSSSWRSASTGESGASRPRGTSSRSQSLAAPRPSSRTRSWSLSGRSARSRRSKCSPWTPSSAPSWSEARG